MDLENLKKKFTHDGFVILRNYYKENDLEYITKISNEVVNKAQKGKWQHIRVYRDYPTFFNKLNIFGVDYPLNADIHDKTFDEIQKLNYKNFILNFLGWKNFYTPLMRLHSNSSLYNYQGEWHRDDPEYPSINSVQVIIYLLNEKGYRIIPKHKNDLLEKHSISKNQTTTMGRGFAELPREMYEIIDVRRGDILIHESGLLHQGFCKKKRLHYHLRHIRQDSLIENNSNDMFNFTEEFMKDYDLSKIQNKTYYELNKINFTIKIIRIKAFIFYFFPRFKSIFNNLFSKKKQSIYHSTIWQ